MALKITLFESLKDPPLASPIRLLSSKSGSSLRAGPNCCPVWSGQKRPQLPQRLHDVRDSKANQSLLHQAFTGEHFWNFSVGVQKLWSHTLPYMGLAPLRQPLAGTCLYKKTGVCTALRCLLHHAKHSAQQGGPGANFYFWTQMIYSWIVRSVL